MRKKTSGKDTAEKRKARRKLSNLAPKRVKGGESVGIKGGSLTFEKWIEV